MDEKDYGKNDSVDSSTDILKEFLKESVGEFVKQIPASQTTNINEAAPKVKSMIDDANGNAKRAIVDAFTNDEKNRLDRQKPLFWVVSGLLMFQLLAFNALMFYLICCSFRHTDIISFEALLEFLKYYVGAVILELLGLLSIILYNTFSSNPGKILGKILNK